MTDPDSGTPELYSTEQVAERLGIQPQSVRAAMARYKIRAKSGWPAAEVDTLRRPGRGHKRQETE